MKIVKISTGLNSDLLLRQTPNCSGVWGDCKFVINELTDKCDWWVVLHGSGLRFTESVCCDPNHVIYVSMEPNEMVGHISDGFHKQFSRIVITDRSIVHPNITYKNFHTWWVGLSVKHSKGRHNFEPIASCGYDELSKDVVTDRLDRISVVTSTKRLIRGHADRLKFVDRLLGSSLSGSIDLYGGGFNPIDDKLDVIRRSKYHLAIENSVLNDYWTEKIADAFLGGALPIYYGAPNVESYFPRGSIIPIDINNFDSSIRNMSEAIERDAYNVSRPSIIKSRDFVLNRYNIFNELSVLCDEPAQSFKKVTLRPNRKFTESAGKGWLKDVLYRFR